MFSHPLFFLRTKKGLELKGGVIAYGFKYDEYGMETSILPGKIVITIPIPSGAE